MVNQVEKGRINKQRYKEYVESLIAKGKKFPVNQNGGVNLTQIAKECGFHRQVFATNKGMAASLEEDIKTVGTEITPPKNTDEYFSAKLSDTEKLAGQLRKQNAHLNEENNALRKQIMGLESEILRLKNAKEEQNESIEYMLQTARRFTL